MDDLTRNLVEEIWNLISDKYPGISGEDAVCVLEVLKLRVTQEYNKAEG